MKTLLIILFVLFSVILNAQPWITDTLVKDSWHVKGFMEPQSKIKHDTVIVHDTITVIKYKNIGNFDIQYPFYQYFIISDIDLKKPWGFRILTKKQIITFQYDPITQCFVKVK